MEREQEQGLNSHLFFLLGTLARRPGPPTQGARLGGGGGGAIVKMRSTWWPKKMAKEDV